MRVLCFGETMGLLMNPRLERFRDCRRAIPSFAGAESNTAIGLARLGCEAEWLSAVGRDPFGDRIVRQLRAEGVGVDQVVTSDLHPTGFMLRERTAWSEPEVFYWRDNSAFRREAMDLTRSAKWDGVGAVYFTGITPALNAEAAAAARALAEEGRRRGAQVWFDVNYRRKLWKGREAAGPLLELAKEADLVFASEEEGRLLTGRDGLPAMAEAILSRGAKQVVFKLGAGGAQCFGMGGHRAHPGFPIGAEVDPIGAGDAFNAGFLAGVLGGKAADESLRLGCACGAMACLTDGDWEGLPTPVEIERFIAAEKRALR